MSARDLLLPERLYFCVTALFFLFQFKIIKSPWVVLTRPGEIQHAFLGPDEVVTCTSEGCTHSPIWQIGTSGIFTSFFMFLGFSGAFITHFILFPTLFRNP